MFQNSYQNGIYFELFDPKASQDKIKSLYKLQNVQTNFKIFDKNLKTFIYEFNQTNSKIIFPKQEKKELYLIQQYLNLQIQFGRAMDWNIELTVSDLTRTKRRIILSPSVQKIEKKPFFVKVPSPEVKEGIWTNFVIDLYSLIEAFKGQTYRSLDFIQITGNIKLRRIFTTPNLVFETNQFESVSLLPKNFYLPPQVGSIHYCVRYQENIQSQENTQPTESFSKTGSCLISSKNIKNQVISNKSTNKSTKKSSHVIEKNCKGEKKFLASSNGLQIRRNRKEPKENSDSKQQIKADKIPRNTDKITSKKQPLSKTQIPKVNSSTQKKNLKLKQRQKQKQKLNPWRMPAKKQNSRYQGEKLNIQRKLQSAQASLFKTKNSLGQKLSSTNVKGFQRRSNSNSDTDYVDLSQKFSTVTQGRFFRNVNSFSHEQKQYPQIENGDEIQENIEVQANSFCSNSNKKAEPLKNPGKLVNQGQIYESIRDSLDDLNSKHQQPQLKQFLDNQSYMNMSSKLGVGNKMMKKFLQQIQRPYSPPLGQRQHTEQHEADIDGQVDREVQLIYDPVLNCYYDHKTHTYYQLKN